MNDLELGKKKHYGVFEAALASVIFIIYNVIFLQLYSLLPVGMRANIFVYYLASFLLEAMFAFSAITVALSRKVDIAHASGMKKKFNGKIVWICFAISIVCLIFFGNITSTFLSILELCGYTQQLSNIVIDTFWKYLIYVVITCATPAFCEELLFRGTILSGLKKYGVKVAVVISAIIFTLMHGTPEQTIHQFIIGVIIGLIFFKTGNLWLGVIIHFFNNFISVTMSYLMTVAVNSGIINIVDSGETVPVTVGSILFSLVITIVLAVIGYLIVKKLIKMLISEDEKVNAKNEALTGTETTINVDGTEVLTTISVDGENMRNEDEILHGASEENKHDKKTKALPVSAIVMFALSGAYLLYDWICALLIGLGVI